MRKHFRILLSFSFCLIMFLAMAVPTFAATDTCYQWRLGYFEIYKAADGSGYWEYEEDGVTYRVMPDTYGRAEITFNGNSWTEDVTMPERFYNNGYTNIKAEIVLPNATETQYYSSLNEHFGDKWDMFSNGYLYKYDNNKSGIVSTTNQYLSNGNTVWNLNWLKVQVRGGTPDVVQTGKEQYKHYIPFAIKWTGETASPPKPEEPDKPPVDDSLDFKIEDGYYLKYAEPRDTKNCYNKSLTALDNNPLIVKAWAAASTKPKDEINVSWYDLACVKVTTNNKEIYSNPAVKAHLYYGDNCSGEKIYTQIPMKGYLEWYSADAPPRVIDDVVGEREFTISAFIMLNQEQINKIRNEYNGKFSIRYTVK